MSNRIEIQIEVDPNGKGAAAIKGINAQLDTVGGSAAKGASGISLFSGALDKVTGFIAGGALVALSKGLLESAVAAEQANRRLSASATEAGLSYGELSKNAQQFAQDARVSKTEAAGTVAELTRLATLAGRTQDLELIQKRFLDLAAARGLATNQLGEIARQVISGQDEGVNKLGLANPGKLYEAYAKSIGKTTEALSQQEQIVAILNPLLDKAATFAGANEDAQKGLTGQTQEASKAVSDLYQNFGTAVAGSNEFRDALTLINELLKNISINADEVRDKLAHGLTPKQIAQQNADQPVNQAIDTVKDSIGVLSVPTPDKFVKAYISDFINGTKDFEQLVRETDQLLHGARGRRIQADTDKIQATKDGDQKQAQQAAAQDINNRYKTLDDQARAADTEHAKGVFDTIARNKNITIQQIKEASEYLTANQYVLPAKDVEKYGKQLQEVMLRQFETIKKTRDEFRSFLTETTGSVSDNKFAKLFIEMDTAAERAQKRFGALGKDVVDFATKLDRLNIAKQINEGIAAGNLSGLKLSQQANALDKPLIGLTGAEERRLSSLEARITALTSSADYRQLAGFYRALNSFDKNGSDVAPSANLAETFQRFTQAKGFDKERLAQIGTGQLDEVLSQVLSLRSLGGANADERGTIAAAVLSKIQSIPDELLRKSTLGSVRSLREIGAESADDAARLQQQKAREAVERELAGNQIRTDALEQLKLARSATGVSKDFQNAQVLAITGELAPNELTGDLRKARADALRSQSALDFNQKNEGLEISRKMHVLLDSINKQITGGKIGVIDNSPGADNPPLIDVKVNGQKVDTSVSGPAMTPDNNYYKYTDTGFGVIDTTGTGYK